MEIGPKSGKEPERSGWWISHARTSRLHRSPWNDRRARGLALLAARAITACPLKRREILTSPTRPRLTLSGGHRMNVEETSRTQRTDNQLILILDETAAWAVRGERGAPLGQT